MKTKSIYKIESYEQLVGRLNSLFKEYLRLKKKPEAEDPAYSHSHTEGSGASSVQARKKEILTEAKAVCKRLIHLLQLKEVINANRALLADKTTDAVSSFFGRKKLGDTRSLSARSLKSIILRYTDHNGILSQNSLRRICFPEKSSTEYLVSMITTQVDYRAGRILFVLKKADQILGLPTMEWIRQIGGSKTADDFLLDIRRQFPMERITELVRQNPHYSAFFRQQYEQEQRNERITRGLVAAIPDTYPDLFPLAREMQRHFVLHIGPTNSGKSYEALEALKEASTGIYLAPLRLLAYEKYEELNEAGVWCSLKTGEEEILVPGATIRSSTIEILDFTKEYEIAVIDEAQMVADPQRGSAWTMALLGVRAETIHVCLAPEAENVIKEIIRACDDTYEVTRHERLVPLITRSYSHPVFPRSAQRGDAFIVFSRRDVHAAASELQRSGQKCSVIYGNLPYDVRRGEVKRYINGETDIIVATDAIGMGLNLPIKRIIFLEMTKFDGTQQRALQPAEIRQIAGRAGRYRIFSEGLVTSDVDFEYMEEAVHTEVPAIERARIGFPYSLIGTDGKVSELMDRWGQIRPKPGFEIADMSREAELARILENATDSKDLVYRFVMFPFDEKDETLKLIWYELFRSELEGRDDFMKWLPDSPSSASSDLRNLEQAFKICDMLYHYADGFTDRTQIPLILQRKSEISAAIMTILAREKLETRQCKRCGNMLPFRYPYDVCRQCHNAAYRHYRRRRR